MKIITNRKVVTDSNPDNIYFHSADAADTKKTGADKVAEAKAKAKKAGYFSTERKEARKEDRLEKKAERIERRTERKLARIAKKGARPLTATVVGNLKKFKDNLPTLRKGKNGTGYEKVDSSGTVTPVAAENVAKVADVLIDKTDAAGKPVATEVIAGVKKAVVNYSENETEEAEAPDGSIQVYKKADTEDAKSTGMSTQTKWILGGLGALAVTGLVIYLIKRSRKGK